MDNAQDVIQFAVDNMGHEVELVLIRTDVVGVAVPAFWTRYGTLTGLGSMGDHTTITVENYRAEPDGEVLTRRTLVGLDEIIDISRA